MIATVGIDVSWTGFAATPTIQYLCSLEKSTIQWVSSIRKRPSNSFDCYIIGHGTILQYCADLILGYGNAILGVVANDLETIAWCQSKNLHVIEFKMLEITISTKPSDYLFSIGNEMVLKGGHFKSLRKLAINLHYGPLPRYGGLNVIQWAIYNRESTHGVTWHRVALEIDQGDIYEQALFDMPKQCTTRSINFIAFDKATSSFENILRKIHQNVLKPLPQDLSKFTYFSRRDVPPRASVLDLHDDPHRSTHSGLFYGEGSN